MGRNVRAGMPFRWERLRWVMLAGILLYVTSCYWHVYLMDDGFTRLIRFGAHFSPNYISRVQQADIYLSPHEGHRFGYDGQFYANLAVDPLLLDEGIEEALDAPTYRARRIGLPWIAHLLGLGHDPMVITIYAVSNYLFWLLLVYLSWQLIPPTNLQSMVCWIGLTAGFGVMTSMRMALTDLPSASLVLLALYLRSSGAGAILGYAALIKETSLLSLPGLLRYSTSIRRFLLDNYRGLLLAILPLAIWVLYVSWRFGSPPGGGARNFSLPLQSLIPQLASDWERVSLQGAEPLGVVWQAMTNLHMLELLVLVGMMVKALYILGRPAWRNPFWQGAVAYALLLFVLGDAVLEGAGAVARSLLPLSFGFYLCLANERRPWLFWPLALIASASIPYGLLSLWLA